MKRVVIVAEIGGTTADPVLFSIAYRSAAGYAHDSIEPQNQPLTRHDIVRMLDDEFKKNYYQHGMTSMAVAIGRLGYAAAGAMEVWFESPEVYRVLVNCGLRVRQERCLINNLTDPDSDMNARLTRLVKYLEETYDNASEKE